MNSLTGTRRLIRLALRRDRVKLPVWLGALTLSQYLSTLSVVGLYDDAAERHDFVVTSTANPVVMVFNGLISGDSLGAAAASQVVLGVVTAAAFMCTLAVVRHTRQNEETGRAELVSSAIVGRHASLTAALVVAGGASVALGLLNVLALLAAGLPLSGSLIEGAAFTASGLCFVAVAAVCAQATQSARGANGLAAAVIGIAFLLRGLGDGLGTATGGGVRVRVAWPSWLSPIGWAELTRPYDRNDWWVLGIAVAFTAVTCWWAYRLSAHRDVGFGLFAARPGPPRAVPGLLSPLGLAWRLQRGVLLGWVIGMAVMAFGMGALGNSLEDLLDTSDSMADAITQLGGGNQDLVDSYFAALFGMMGLGAGGYAVQVLLRLRSEETGALETILATATSRMRFLASHLAIAVGGVAVLMFVAGAGTELVFGVATGDLTGDPGRYTGAALVQIPAVLVVVGVATVAFGLLPRYAVSLSWAALAVCILFSLIGQLLKLPQAVLDVSPFSHVPLLPAVALRVLPLVVMLVVAAALMAAGAGLFRRRDIVP